MMNYAQQIKHPLWQKKRLEVLELYGFQCQECGEKEEELHVHHPFYRRGAMIWQYEKEELKCLCCQCHKDEHGIDEAIKKELASCLDKKAVLEFIKSLSNGAVVPKKLIRYKRPLPAVFRKPFVLEDGTVIDSAESLKEFKRRLSNGEA
jgi:hypothetical protein